MAPQSEPKERRYEPHPQRSAGKREGKTMRKFLTVWFSIFAILVAMIGFFNYPILSCRAWEHWTEIDSFKNSKMSIVIALDEGEIRHNSLSYEFFKVGDCHWEYFNHTVAYIGGYDPSLYFWLNVTEVKPWQDLPIMFQR